MHPPARVALAIFLALTAAGAGPAADSDEVTAVHATVHNGYARVPLPDGTCRPETYAFGEGGRTDGGRADPALDRLSFRQIARTLAPGLARQNFLTSRDPAQTDLLIMVYWGETGTDHRPGAGFASGPAPVRPPPPPPKLIVVGNKQRVYIPNQEARRGPPDSPDQAAADAMMAMQNRERDRANLQTAELLGYAEALDRASVRPTSRTYLDLVDELEDDRYFVILRAYDFRRLWRDKEPRLLWEARYSVRARGHRFDEALATMTAAASRHFGRPTRGLQRLELPAGEVRLGEPEFREYLAGAPEK